jgi:hypothetical protein
VCTLLTFLADGLRYLRLRLRPSSTLAAENLVLRKQLTLRVSPRIVRKYLPELLNHGWRKVRHPNAG